MRKLFQGQNMIVLDGMGSGVEEGESIPNGDTALALVGGDLGALGESLGGMNVVAILEWVMIILPIVMGFLGTVRGKVAAPPNEQEVD